jgi:hypothetical protein
VFYEGTGAFDPASSVVIDELYFEPSRDWTVLDCHVLPDGRRCSLSVNENEIDLSVRFVSAAITVNNVTVTPLSFIWSIAVLRTPKVNASVALVTRILSSQIESGLVVEQQSSENTDDLVVRE